MEATIRWRSGHRKMNSSVAIDNGLTGRWTFGLRIERPARMLGRAVQYSKIIIVIRLTNRS
jgi:hypothetical protein